MGNKKKKSAKKVEKIVKETIEVKEEVSKEVTPKTEDACVKHEEQTEEFEVPNDIAIREVLDMMAFGDQKQWVILSVIQGVRTEAMQIGRVGCIVKIDSVLEDSFTTTFIPQVRIEEKKDNEGEIIERKLVAII